MLIGFNNDVDYRDTTFHIQTEDHGENDPRIESQIFFSGAIVDTVITSYEETIEGYEGEAADERIRAQMKASHRSLFKKLMAGEYDEFAGLEPLDDDKKPSTDDPDEFTPSQERVPAAAAQIEEDGEDAILEFQKKKAKNHVSLDKLKSQLSGLDEKSDGSAEPDQASAADLSVTQEDPTSSQGASSDPAASEAGTNTDRSPAQDDQVPTQILDTSAAGLDISSAAVEAAEAAGGSDQLEYPPTGVQAWNGCPPSDQDLSLTGLVEEFLGL